MSSKLVLVISFSGIVLESCARTDLMFLESHINAVAWKTENLSLSYPQSLHGQEEFPEVNEDEHLYQQLFHKIV